MYTYPIIRKSSLEQGLALLNTLVTTLTKGLNTDPKVTFLLIRGRELFPLDVSDHLEVLFHLVILWVILNPDDICMIVLK